MENGRNNDDGISGRQLRELLRSLPAAHAPEDLELNLLYRINENEAYPHRSRLQRFPRTRAAASESVQPTRGIDRMRGLAAAALAAFLVVGGWTVFSDGNISQSAAVQATQPVSAPAIVTQPAPNAANGTVVEETKPSQSVAKPHILSPIELEWTEEAEPKQPVRSVEKSVNAPSTTIASPAPHATPAPRSNVKTPSTQVVTPADSIASAPRPDSPNIGTGGPMDDIEND